MSALLDRLLPLPEPEPVAQPLPPVANEFGWQASVAGADDMAKYAVALKEQA